MAQALGIDIGGTGIKGALVDTDSGELLTDRIKLPTPEGGAPNDIVKTVVELIAKLGGVEDDVPLGVCFPAIVRNGRTMSAANVSKKWIGLEAEALFEKASVATSTSSTTRMRRATPRCATARPRGSRAS